MPNHVMNIVTFNSRIDEIRAFVKGTESPFDFESITPMPESVKASAGKPSDGLPEWYEWACANWGTKWNCYQVQEIEGGFSFWTAWATPCQVLCALSEQFPDVTITVQFADEDLGNNCGRYELNAGDMHDFTQFDGDYEFVCEVWGYEYTDVISSIEFNQEG